MDRTDNRLTGEQRRAPVPPWILALVFSTLAAGLSSLICDRGFTSYDDGVAAEGARLVLLGKVPYRDFWTLYAPGSYYVNALLMAAFGQSLLAIRLAQPVLVAVQAALLFGIISRLRPSLWVYVVAAVAFLAFIPIGLQAAGPMSYWATTAMATAYFLVRWIERPSLRWALPCGLCLGIGALFRQDGGVYLAAGLLPVVWLAAPVLGGRRWTSVLAFACPAAAVVAGAAVYFAARGALGAMIDDTLRFAVGVFPTARRLPYPIPWREAHVIARYNAPVSIAFGYQLFGFYVLPAALALAGGLGIRRLARREADRTQVTAAALACCALVPFLMARVRPAGAHIPFSAILCLAAFAALCAESNRAARTASRVLLLAAAVSYLPMGAYSAWVIRSFNVDPVLDRGGVYASAGYGLLVSVTSAKISKLTRASDRILAGAPAVYFLAARDPATRYYEPHPGLTDTLPIQRSIIRDMERKRVRFFVRSQEWGSKTYFTMEPEYQPTVLIDYIEANYRIVVDYRLFRIYRRATPFARPPARTR